MTCIFESASWPKNILAKSGSVSTGHGLGNGCRLFSCGALHWAKAIMGEQAAEVSTVTIQCEWGSLVISSVMRSVQNLRMEGFFGKQIWWTASSRKDAKYTSTMEGMSESLAERSSRGILLR